MEQVETWLKCNNSGLKKIYEKLFTELYRGQDGQEDEDEPNDSLNLDVPNVTREVWKTEMNEKG